jgi:hypothetical protein
LPSIDPSTETPDGNLELVENEWFDDARFDRRISISLIGRHATWNAEAITTGLTLTIVCRTGTSIAARAGISGFVGDGRHDRIGRRYDVRRDRWRILVFA